MIENRNRIESVLVIIAYVVMIALNAVSSIFAGQSGMNIGQISNVNPTYITPDGLTFSVWGVIYTGQLAYTIYQAIPSHLDDKELVASRLFAVGAFVLNGIWLFLFTRLYWWLQWADIVAYLVLLIQVYRHMDIDYFNTKKPWQYVLCNYVGFSCNLAWVTVATAVSTTTTFRQQGWVTLSKVPGELAVGVNADWAFMWIVIVGVISSAFAFYKGDIPHNLITAWALSGIIRQQTIPNAEAFPVSMLSPEVANWALGAEILVLVFAVASAIKIIYEKFVVQQHDDDTATNLFFRYTTPKNDSSTKKYEIDY